MSILLTKNDNAIRNILNLVDVPELRKDFTKVSNVRWLLRNVLIRNNTLLGNELVKLLKHRLYYMTQHKERD